MINNDDLRVVLIVTNVIWVRNDLWQQAIVGLTNPMYKSETYLMSLEPLEL